MFEPDFGARGIDTSVFGRAVSPGISQLSREYPNCPGGLMLVLKEVMSASSFVPRGVSP